MSKKSTAITAHAETQIDDPIWGVVRVLVSALFFARFLIPTESASSGETLWIVQLWIAGALLWVWSCFRRREFSLCWSLNDVAVGLLVGGHVLGSLVVIATEGQKRAAFNMLWEWVGLGLAFFLLRQIVNCNAARRQWAIVLISLSLTLAVFGVWQHFVWYPQAVVAYDTLRSELDELEEQETSSLSNSENRRQRRIQRLQLQLINTGVPPYALAGRSRQLFEQRLRSSTEPFGLFALANTFGGLLVVGFLLLAGFVSKENRTLARGAICVIISLLIGDCLLLTKSRTAWVGILAGGILWAWLKYGGRLIQPKLMLRIVLSVFLLVVFAIGIGFYTGGLDEEVLSEAPKSLKYRVEYWRGTWSVISESPLVGTGPGNFRSHYLKHKLPESSEEISDPHNMFLDVWVNGGLLGLVGLVCVLACFCAAIVRHAWEPPDIQKTDDSREESKSRADRSSFLGACFAFALVLGWLLLFRETFDIRLAVIGAIFVGVYCSMGAARVHYLSTSALFCSAAVGLLVHLCGAGGIAMPAITQLVLLMLILALSDDMKAGKSAQGELVRIDLSQRRSITLCGVTFALLFVFCLITGTAPVENSRAHLRAAGIAPSEAMAIRHFSAAAEADPFSPVPAEALAAIFFRRWQSEREDSPSDFDRALKFARIASELDPNNANGSRRLADFFLARYERSGSSDDLREAITSQREAIDRYPTHAVFRVELAKMLDRNDDSVAAAGEAKQALQLDELNRAAGHVDKYLQEEEIEELRQLANK